MDKATLQKMAQRLEETGVHPTEKYKDPNYIGGRLLTRRVGWMRVLGYLIHHGGFSFRIEGTKEFKLELVDD